MEANSDSEGGHVSACRTRTGTVYLVGAGPGDPGLLTRRAASVLRRADIVLHDSLLSAGVLRLAAPTAERIDVGKRCGRRRRTEGQIHELLIEAAKRARVVVRLKGGDPFIFGRGGEDALALRAAGVRYVVVPGVTAAVGAAAFAGIPLTHRGVSTGVTFITGHGCADAGDACVDWQRHAGPHHTLAVYMGTKQLAHVADRLIEAGRSPQTPAAVIEWGTYARQRTITAPLADLAARAAGAGIGTPALVVIGEVVGLRSQIRWLERRPLHGLRVIVARSRTQPSRIAHRLTALGADVHETPLFDVAPPADNGPLVRAIGDAARYDWVAFTDATAVHEFWRAATAMGRDARTFAACGFAAFGTATAAALARHGVRADVVTASFVPSVAAAHLLAQTRALASTGVSASGSALAAVDEGRLTRVLLPRAAGGESPIAVELRSAGAVVDEVTAYRALPRLDNVRALRDELAAGQIQLVVFASSSSVRQFAEILGAPARNASNLRIAAIGPCTAAAAREVGLAPHLMPEEASMTALLRAIHG